jgi:ATP-dependent DNA ligase
MSIYGFKPQKGKAYDKLPKKTLTTFNDTEYIVSTKYDGNQIFITKVGADVRMFTSDWKEFSIAIIVEELKDLDYDFVVVGEYMHDSAGNLGCRTLSAKLTTYRTNFKKGLLNQKEDEEKTNIVLFDYLEVLGGCSIITDVPYSERLANLDELEYDTLNSKHLNIINYETLIGEDARLKAEALINDGWEGAMLVEPDSPYEIGKRVNHSIKLKNRPTADLECIAINAGEGKYAGLIGSLTLLDSHGRTVDVGSGLSDGERLYGEHYFVGKIIEIQYEQILDTYIQPTYVRIRDDKTKGE